VSIDTLDDKADCRNVGKAMCIDLAIGSGRNKEQATVSPARRLDVLKEHCVHLSDYRLSSSRSRNGISRKAILTPFTWEKIPLIGE
jgi:hypothetical protein